MKENIFKTLKISIASIASILIALAFHLEFYISSGIVTILTIQSTKSETIQTATQRFIAFIIALIISFITFNILEYSLLGYLLYLLIYIFVCVIFNWTSSMAVNSVLISHFLTFKTMDISTIFNELGIFIIGVGIGILINLHLRKDDYGIYKLKRQTDEQIIYILNRMSQRILKEIDHYDGHCFDKLNEILTQAKFKATQNEKNSFDSNNYDKDYLKMREHQAQVLYEMYKLSSKLNTNVITSKIISDFLLKISKLYHNANDCTQLLKEFYEIDSQMKSVPLPNTRNEFENRAYLFGLLRLIEEFLMIKHEFMNKYQKLTKKDS